MYSQIMLIGRLDEYNIRTMLEPSFIELMRCLMMRPIRKYILMFPESEL